MTQSAFTPKLKAKAVAARDAGPSHWSEVRHAAAFYELVQHPTLILALITEHEEQGKALRIARTTTPEQREELRRWIEENFGFRTAAIDPKVIGTCLADLAALRAENEAARHAAKQDAAAAEHMHRVAIAAEQSADALRRRVEKLEAALRKHGRHEVHCSHNQWPKRGEGFGHCNCALAAALAEDAAEKTTPTGKPTI